MPFCSTVFSYFFGLVITKEYVNNLLVLQNLNTAKISACIAKQWSESQNKIIKVREKLLRRITLHLCHYLAQIELRVFDSTSARHERNLERLHANRYGSSEYSS